MPPINCLYSIFIIAYIEIIFNKYDKNFNISYVSLFTKFFVLFFENIAQSYLFKYVTNSLSLLHLFVAFPIEGMPPSFFGVPTSEERNDINIHTWVYRIALRSCIPLDTFFTKLYAMVCYTFI